MLQLMHSQKQQCYMGSRRTKELHIVLHGLSIERMQHGMAGAICGCSATVRLPAFAIIIRLTAKCSLVDLAFVCA